MKLLQVEKSMSIKKIILLATIVATTLLANAQREKITFLETSYDYGMINESGAPVTHKFLFVNEGKEAMRIQGAKASCGCTTPGWSQNPIFPGDTGYVEATYDPDNRPGNFYKTIMVYFEKTMLKEELKIMGFVQPTLGDKAYINYPKNNGFMRFKSQNLNVGSADLNEPITKIFQVQNNSASPMTLELVDKLPSEANVVFEPQTIPSKFVGNIRVTYTATESTPFGMSKFPLKIKTNDIQNKEKTFWVHISVQESFTEEQKNDPNRPVLSIPKKDIFLGNITEGESTKTSITYTNTGKSPLTIRSINSSCSCIVTKSKKNQIAPGASATIKVKFDATGKSSYVNSKITFTTTDPVNPKQEVAVRAKVVK